MEPITRSGPVFALAALAGLLAACGSGETPTPSAPPMPTRPAAPAPPSASPSAGDSLSPVLPVGDPSTLVTGLDAPWSIVFTEDDVALVDERDTGRILEVRGDGSTREIGEVDGVLHGGEGGLLGLAIRDDDLYAYSTGSGGNRIQRFAIIGEPGDYGLGTAETIHEGLPSAQNHNGGRIAFGPDGMLYASVGDAGNRAAAQDPGAHAGSILRMEPDGGVPADNPFPDSLVYSYGHRNVQGLAWDADGTMFAAEFGQNTWDELNIIEPGGNYGWPTVEGAGGADQGFIDPILQWSPTDASPSGIAIVYKTVFIANLRGERLRAVPIADPAAQAQLYVGEFGRIRDVTVAPDGRLLFLTNNTDGRGAPAEQDDRVLTVELE